MKSTLFATAALAFLFALPSTPLALPTTTPPPYPANGTTPTTNNNGTITPPSRYYLRTRVKGYVYSDDDDKDGLYVSAYHTGAGENDATLESRDVAAAGYLNGSNQQFDLGTPFPWGMEMVDLDPYAEWDFVAINAGYGDTGFFFNASGLQWEEYEGTFGGWLACDWWHGIPQLFWKAGYYDAKYPSTCSEVDLLPVAITE